MENVAPVLNGIGFVLAIRAAAARSDGNRLGGDRAALPKHVPAKHDRQNTSMSSAARTSATVPTRIERGNEAGTVEIYISHRGTEQVSRNPDYNNPNSPSGFVWRLMRPDPGLEAEMLTRS